MVLPLKAIWCLPFKSQESYSQHFYMGVHFRVFADPQILSHSFDAPQILSLNILRPEILSHILDYHCHEILLNITWLANVYVYGIQTLEFGFLLQLHFNFQTPKI